MIKHMSRTKFIAGHVGVIVFHILLAAFIIFATWKSYRIGLYVAGGLLMVISVWSFAPIFKRVEWQIEE